MTIPVHLASASLLVPYELSPLGIKAVRFAFVSGQLLSTGAAVLALLALPRALAPVEDDRYASAMAGRAHRVVGALGVLLLVTTLVDLVHRSSASAGTSFAAGLSPRHLGQVLGQPAAPGAWIGPGALETVTVGPALLSAVAGLVLLRGPSRARGLTAVRVIVASALVSLLLPALPARLRGLTLQSVLDPIASQSHILGGSVWVGGLVLAAALLLLRPASARRLGDLVFWPRFWEVFSATASVALGVVVVSGSWLVWTRVGSPGNVLTTAYGRAVAVKLSIVAVMAVLGGINHVHLIPGIRRARATGDQSSVLRIAVRQFRLTVVVEALLGIAVIGVVPFLTGSAREEAASASGRPYTPAVLDLRAATVGLLGIGVTVLLLWGATRVADVRSGSGDRQDA